MSAMKFMTYSRPRVRRPTLAERHAQFVPNEQSANLLARRMAFINGTGERLTLADLRMKRPVQQKNSSLAKTEPTLPELRQLASMLNAAVDMGAHVEGLQQEIKQLRLAQTRRHLAEQSQRQQQPIAQPMPTMPVFEFKPHYDRAGKVRGMTATGGNLSFEFLPKYDRNGKLQGVTATPTKVK